MIEPGAQIGRYTVRRKLAEGGMAEIYLAVAKGPEGFEKDVVIKRIRSFLASDPGFVQMFIAEARVASRLNHPNLVQIFDFEKHEDSYFIAMEYVRGHSLWDARARARERMSPMPPTLVAHVGAQVAAGLHYAHRLTQDGRPLGLVHRDVTPHNVLLSFDGAIKLTDFGIARTGERLTSPGALKGKYAYMSPEQSRGHEVDARTDVFALGIVLWELLTGGRLFEGDSDVAMLRAVQQSAIAPPARLNPEVPDALDAIVMRALQRDPRARFQTAGEMERALAHVVVSAARSPEDTSAAAWLKLLYPDEASVVGPVEVELASSAAPPVTPDEDPVGPTDIARPRSQPATPRARRWLTAIGFAAVVMATGWVAGVRKPPTLAVSPSPAEQKPEPGPPATPAPKTPETPAPIDAPPPVEPERPAAAPAVAERRPARRRASGTLPPWIQQGVVIGAARAPEPVAVGVPSGSEILARLTQPLDSRTLGARPIAARLPRPFVVQGRIALPSGTMFFGTASPTPDGRFELRFVKLRLPDSRELVVHALAYDREDRQPGLRPSERLRQPGSSEVLLLDAPVDLTLLIGEAI